MEPRESLPYWLDGGTETCDFCACRYVLQVELRCAGCDRGACEHCVVVVRGEVTCAECREGEDG